MKRWNLILVLAAALWVSACGDWDNPKAARAKRAADSKGDIVVGAVWPWQGPKGSLWVGMELAVEEINGAGGVLGRPLRIVKEDDESSLAKGGLIAQQFAENLDMVAVIGHLNSYIAVPASITYQDAGLLYLTPGASSYQLNNQGYDLVFRSIPSNRSVGQHMATYMAGKGYRRVAIYYVKDKNSQDMANYFEQQAKQLGLTVVDRRSFMQGTQDFGDAIQNWKDLYEFDALFVAANMPEAANFLIQARRMEFTVPIVGGDGMDTSTLIELAGAAAEGVVVPESFVPDREWPPYRRFNELVQAKFSQSGGYDLAAHTQAVQGYDSIHLLVQAIRRANSTAPADVAAALRATKDWPGATGVFTFNDKGDIPYKPIGQKVVKNGAFVSLH